MLPFSVESREVSWNQVEKLAVEICCSISASAFFQTSYISEFDLLLRYYSIGKRVFHRFLGKKKYGVIKNAVNRGVVFHMKKIFSRGDVENCLKIVEKCGILYKEFEIK